MSGAGAVNLSLLSRGVGEVQRNGHEKVEVFLEPEDYYNFRDDPHRYYLPPIKHNYAMVNDTSQISSRDLREHHEIHLPKTFTTRKGALLLFSEDLALKDSERDHADHGLSRGKEMDSSHDGPNLKTVDDLAKSILSYGSNEGNSVCMKFIHRKRAKFQRQIRPGFSAKRYLATWTRSWDDSVLETVINKGYITERSLFQYNFVIPHLRRRIFHEDLSHYPPPYRLMRNMLLSPGSLSGYTFYRAVPEFEDMLDEYAKGDVDLESMRSRPPTSIKVIRTRDGQQREVSYASLDKKSKEEVITDLLVKSAVHYALKRQQEYLAEDINEVMEANVKNTSFSESDRKMSSSMKTPVQQFDMKDAVESLLDSHRQFDADLPAVDSGSHSSYGGSFKGAAIPQHSVKGHSAKTRSWPYGIDEAGKEYIGNTPVVTLREGSSSPSGSVTSLPQLPAVKKHPLTPIKDVSRETTQNIILPPIHGADGVPDVNVEPPTPQHSTLMKTTDDTHTNQEVHVVPSPHDNGEWKTTEKRLHQRKKKGDHSHHSSMESIPHSGVQSIPSKNRPHWKGSQQSIGSRKGPGSVIGDGSLKGSVICAPDGEIISVGGSVGPTTRQSDIATLHDVMTVNKRVGDGEVEESIPSDGDEPEEWKQSRQRVHAEGGGAVVDRKHSQKDIEVSQDIDPSPSMRQWNYVRGEQVSQASGPPSLHSGSKHSASVHTLSSSQLEQESSASEQMLVNALTEHAQKIAQSVLQGNDSGHNLEADIRHAASLWTERHPVRDISRSQSVQEKPNTDAIEEIMQNQRTSSVDITAEDYREQIRQNLTTAVAKAAGLTPDLLPADAAVSPELLDALANQSLSPEDIEIVRDEETGQSTLRSKSQLSKVMGGVKEGHIYVPPGGSEEQTVSIQAERVSVKDVGDVDVINYGLSETGELNEPGRRSKGGSKASSKAPSIKDGESDRSGRKPSETSQGLAAEDIAQAVENIEQVMTEAVPPGDTVDTVSPDAGSDKGSTKTGVSKVSQKSVESKKSVKKKPIPLEDRDEFVVGKVDNKKEMEQLYGPVEVPPPKPSPPKPPAEKKSPEVQPPKEASPLPADVKEESPQEEKVQVHEMKEEVKEVPAELPPPSAKPATISVQPPVKTETKSTTPTKPQPHLSDEGRVDTKTELANLYSQLPPPQQQPKKAVKGKPKTQPKVEKPLPPKKEVKKKEKKTKKKKVEAPPPPPPQKEPTPPTTEPARTATPKKESPVPFESPVASPDNKSEDMDFVFVRDTTQTPEVKEPTPIPREPTPPRPRPPSIEENEPEEEDVNEEDVKQISNKDARLAKRAAAAAKKREEVERRRREKEEEIRRQKEEAERQEQLRKEMEEERKKRDEERRLRKLKQEEERKKEEQAAIDRERKKQLELERERKAKEEYQRKLEEMRKKQAEEEQRRLEAQLKQQQEEEERRLEEEEMMSKMAEQERLEYERRKREEEELRRQREEEEKRRREEEAQKALEEAKRLAEEMARRQAELEARLKFNRDLQLESHGLSHTQDITRMFVFSYFELLQWLGLDLPELELQKLLQFNKA